MGGGGGRRLKKENPGNEAAFESVEQCHFNQYNHVNYFVGTKSHFFLVMVMTLNELCKRYHPFGCLWNARRV